MKRRIGKRLVAIALAAALTGVLAACNPSGETPSSNPSTQPVSSGSGEVKEFSYPMEPITLTLNQPAWETNLADYLKDGHTYWDQWTEKTGVTLECIGGDSGAQDPSEQFILMLASGSYPDLMMANWLNFPGGPSAAMSEGYIIPLNDYEQYYPNLLNVLKTMDDGKYDKDVRTDDGILYVFPTLYDNAALHNTGAAIRKDWLDDLGMEVPTTIDECYNVLKAFKEKKNATAPLTFENRWLFLENAASSLSSPYEVTYPFFLKDNKVVFGPMEEGYKEFVTEMAKWYKEGLIAPDMPSVDKKTTQAKFASGEAGICIMQSANMVNAYNAATAQDSKFAVAGMPSLVKNKGDRPAFGHSSNTYSGAFCIGISSQSKNIEAACRFLDYFYSDEGIMTFAYGEEGYSYTMENDKPKFTDMVMDNPDGIDRESARFNLCRFTNWPAVVTDTDGHKDQYVKDIKEVWMDNDADKYLVPPITQTTAESNYITSKYNSIDTYSREMITKFIIGAEPIEKYDDFINTIKSYGIDQVLEMKQAAYDRYLKR